MRQEFLIKRIIEALDLPDMGSTPIPSIKPNLYKDENGPERRQKWHYCLVIGMLNYLEKTTCPDLTFAVPQAARFSVEPKLSHERAIHRIVKYLVGTKDKGLVFRPNKDLGVVCHVDAGFAGLWNKLDAESPTLVLSRTGYVIQYCGCPLVWMSKFQTEVALSTTEAEYITLSQTMREIVLLIGLLSNISPMFGIVQAPPNLKCTLFEDNNGCLQLARAPRMNPCTKYIRLKYHYFRSYVQNKLVKIEPVDTTNQLADMLTKSLESPQFCKLRKELLGW